MKLAVVGNRDYRNPDFAVDTLNLFYEIFRFCREFIIVSGNAPDKRGTDGKGNVDQIAKKWANRMKRIHNNVDYLEFSPERYVEEEFKKRNKLISDNNHLCLGFINQGQYYSGTFNTIKHMTEKIWFSSFIIFNEEGMEWEFDKYPNWLKKRLTDPSYLIEQMLKRYNIRYTYEKGQNRYRLKR
jgi:hypothetical protein